MLNCHALDSLVTPYIDGELTDDDRRAIADHLRACAPCHSRVAAERAVHDLIHARKKALDAPRAPETLRAACADLAAQRRQITLSSASPVARVPSLSGPLAASASWRARVAPYALAASLVVVVGGAFVYQATDRSARVLAAELTADHLRCFAMNGVLGTHQAAAAVESSMMSSFGWNVHLPENGSRAGLELVGARPCLYGEGRTAHIMYRHDGRPVSLFMLPKTTRTRELVDVLGHEAAIWCDGDRTFVLIAREPRPQLEQLASFVQREIH